MATKTLGTILEVLDGLDSDMILSDGGTNWRVDNLIDALKDAEEADDREYAVGYTTDGRLTISELTDSELKDSPPAYVQVAD